jgi:hypothetical protein
MDELDSVEVRSGDATPGPRPRRHRRRWLAVAAASIAILVVATGYLYLANAYLPLSVTGGGTDMSPDNLYVRTADGEFGARTAEVFCSTANGRFAVLVGLVNDGPFPITLIGGDPGPSGPITDHTNGNGFALVDLAPYRSADGNPQDARLAPTLAPTTLGPGQALDVWARYRLGPQTLQSGAEMATDRIWLRFSTFGIERTAEVRLMVDIAVTANCGG